jgi:HEAT repeat protein
MNTTALACDTLEECIDQIPNVASGDAEISMVDLAAKIQIYKTDAIPGLLKLIFHENKEIRNIASYTLRDIEGLTEKDLPSLIKASKAGEDWLPPAIARIGSEQAIRYLVEELKKYTDSENQVGFAFKILGEKGVPYLVEQLACESNCEVDFFHVIVLIFELLGERAESGVDGLLDIGQKDKYDLIARQSAILSLGEIKEPAFKVADALLILAGNDPDNFEDTVGTALQKMGHPSAAEPLIRKLQASSSSPFGRQRILRDIAELGTNAGYAGPEVEKLLSDPDWDVRVAAARTLGLINYTAAVPALINITQDERDWRLVYMAVISLGELKEESALTTLKKLSVAHWYPPVRDEAKKAIDVINREAAIEDRTHNDNIALTFLSYEHAGSKIKTCERVAMAIKKEPKSVKLHKREDKLALEKHVYQLSDQTGYLDEETDEIVEGPVTYHDIIPDLALKVSEGWLLGSNRGEWGGELMFAGDNGKTYNVINDNIENIYPTAAGIMALTGLWHMTMNNGMVHKLSKNSSGQWQAEPYITLPGAPGGSSLLENGSILVHTYGGSVIINNQGQISMANCIE